MIKSTFDLEKELLEQGYEMIIGVDEAGKGPLAGPVVACAASLKNISNHLYPPRPLAGEDVRRTGEGALRNCTFPSSAPASRGTFSRKQEKGISSFDLIRDSKMLNHKQRESLYDFIHEHFYVGVGICDHKTIDRINILQASFLAMKSALNALTHNANRETQETLHAPRSTFYDMRKIVLIDGNGLIPNFSLEQKAIVRGDRTVKSISAASIIAKVTRDRIMLEMHEKYPEYGFDKHKGYGTKLHMEMLTKHGPSEIHRQSFAPVKLARGE